MITDLLRIPLLTIRGIYEKTDVMNTNVLGGRNYWECIWNLLIIFIFIFVYRKWKTQIRIFVKKIENSWKMALFILCIDISALFLVMWMAGFFDGGYYSDFNLITNVLLILILLLLFIIYVFRSMYRYNKLEKTSLVEQKEKLTKEYQFIRTYCELQAKSKAYLSLSSQLYRGRNVRIGKRMSEYTFRKYKEQRMEDMDGVYGS